MLVQQKLSLLYASLLNKQQRKEKNMDLMKDVQTALIVDDNSFVYNGEHEIEGLKRELQSHDIYYRHFLPNDILSNRIELKNHQLIFMDFSLDDTDNDVNNANTIRRILSRICKQQFGAYGLILWTKHINQIDTLLTRLSKDAQDKAYTTPLFIVGMDKMHYLRNGYDTLFADLNNALSQNKAAAFFFNWRTSVEQGADKALNDVYTLMPDYTNQQTNFQYLLYLLALNYSGVHVENNDKYNNMFQDAYKSFDDLLYNDLISKQKENMTDVFGDRIVNPWQDNQEQRIISYAQLNSKMYIDEIINQQIVSPGNVYEVKDDIASLKSQKKWPINDYVHIALDITPPCDVAQNNTSFARLIGGFMIECPRSIQEIKTLKNRYAKDSQNNIYPIQVGSQIRWICFDFTCVNVVPREDLKNEHNYKLLFMLKRGLYAEVQRQFVSHAGRLGTSLLTF